MQEPHWLSGIRASATSAFESMPLPKSQYTSLKINFSELPEGSNTFLSPHVESLINDTSKMYFVQAGSRVYVNVPEKFKDDVILCDIKKALREYEDIVKDFFSSRAIKYDENKLTSFNFSRFDCGMFLWVNRGADVGTIHYMLDAPEGTTTIGQNIIIAGDDSKLTLVEENFSQPGKESFHSYVTEIHAGENANIDYVSFQNFSGNVTSMVARRAVVEKDAKLNWVFSRLGSKLSRDVRDTDLVGQGASVGDVEVFFGSGSQHFDITSNINHKVPNTVGNVLVKGVLRDSARSVSQGMIRIDKNAQKTDSFLAEHTLLLSRNARSDAVPGLEIEANDVKATHSASVSQIDSDQIFYLESRGLAGSDAKKLIVLGFLESALGKIADGNISDKFKRLIEAKWGKAMFDAAHIKKDFPILEKKINGKDLVYLDNAATTQKPKRVIDALSYFYQNYNANVHRAVHSLSAEATERYESTRIKVAGFINAHPQEIIFTRNATESLNLVAFSMGMSLEKGDEIITTVMEHHSNIVPWQMLEDRGVVVKYVDVNDDGMLKMEDYDNSISKKTKIVAVTHVSNLLGTINPVKKIGEAAHDAGAIFVVDGAQSVPHMPVDVSKLDADFLAFSGHKMLGPMGIGVLYGKRHILEGMQPFLRGGDMIKEVRITGTTFNDIPHKFEAGTPSVADTIAFGEAVRYLSNLGMDEVRHHEKDLTEYALKQIEQIQGIKMYGPGVENRAGIITFNIGDIHSHDVASLLDEEGIAIRSGHGCAMPLVNRLGTDSVCRSSFYIYNTKEDVDALISGIEKVKRIFKIG